MKKSEAEKLAVLIKGLYPCEATKEELAEAWWEMLGDADYNIVKNGLIKFAMQDMRENNELPSPGTLYKAFNATYLLYKGVKELAKEGLQYHNLNETAQDLVNKDLYNKLLLMDEDEIDKVDIHELAK